MSIASQMSHIEYPESDGRPMGETDLHRLWMTRILDILKYRYRNQRVYAASNLLVYYEEGHPTRFVVPDDFVVLDCDARLRGVFKTWEEQRVPDVVFEVTSRSTSREDWVDKPPVYQRMGVKEYFLYDPRSVYLTPPLQGFRLTDGELVEIRNSNGRLLCETLDIELQLNGQALEMLDRKTGQLLLTEAEAEREAKEAERRAKDSERAARLAAEARVAELQEEIDRLRKEQQSDDG